MNSKFLIALGAIVIVLGIVGVITLIPELPPQCKAGDGVCPHGCSYETDSDCLKSEVTSFGEIHRCLSSQDCLIVEPLCGNSECISIDKQCATGCICAVAINKDYERAWDLAKPECLGELKCEPCPDLEEFKTECLRGQCVIKLK